MATCKDKQFDLAIVDPPYGIGEHWMKSKRTYRYGKKSWNNDIPDKNYFDELFRISKNQIILGGNYYCHYLPITNAWIIWDKDRNADKTFMSECELAWTSFPIVMQKVKIVWDGAKKSNETGILNIHPNQRPLKLYEWFLNKFSKPSDKIFDSHLGSQSSRIAAYDMGFDFWGCEIDADYFRDGCKRFEIFKAQQVIEFNK